MRARRAFLGAALMLISVVLSASPAAACHGQTVQCDDASWTDNNMSPDTVTIEPAQRTVLPGGSTEYHIKMTLSPGCGNSYFLYTSLGAVPAGWRATYTSGPGGTGEDYSYIDNRACGSGNVVINGYLNVTAPDWATEGMTAVITAMMGADDNARNDKDLVNVKTTTKVHIPDPPVVVVNAIPDFEIPEDGEDSTHVNLASTFKDTDNDPVAYGVLPPTNLTVKIQADGRVTIAPKKDWNGVETITFTCTDGITTAYDDVAVTVTPLPDPPVVASPMKDFAIPEDGEDGTTINLNNVFYDADVVYGDRLSYKFTGQVNISIVIKADSKVLFKPPPGWSGRETINFTATDLTGSQASDDVEVLVTDSSRPPFVRMPVRDVTIAEDRSDSSIDLKEVFGDPDADSVLEYGCSGASYIKVQIINGIVTLTPAPNWNGVEVLEFWASDGMFSPVFDDSRVTVTPVNDKPYQKEFLSITFNEDTVPPTVFLGEYFADVDGDRLTYSARSPEGLTITIYSKTSEMVLSPALNFHGNLLVNLSIDDGQDGIQVGIPINITPVDDPPMIVDWLPGGSIVRTEGEEVEVSITATDIDGDELGYLWEVDQCFTYLKRFQDQRQIKFKATSEFGLSPGVHILTAWVDGAEKSSVSHSWSVTIRPGNRPPSVPVITSPSPTVNYTSSQKIKFAATSDDPDQDPVTFKWLIDGVEVSNQQTFLITLAVGAHRVKVVAMDDKGASAESEEMIINVIKPSKTPSANSSPGLDGLVFLVALGAVSLLLHRKHR